jgi:hypothetical protein
VAGSGDAICYSHVILCRKLQIEVADNFQIGQPSSNCNLRNTTPVCAVAKMGGDLNLKK